MTIVNVPARRGLLTWTDILSGRAVRAITWQDWANLVNWMRGRGAQLAASHAPSILLGEGSTYQTHMLTRGNFTCIQRVWTFWMRGDGDSSSVDISVAGGTATTYAVPAARTSVTPIVVVQDVASQQSAAEDLRYDITPDGADIFLDGVSVYEVPRVQLDDATAELGVPTSPFSAGQPHRNADLTNGATILGDDEYGRRHLFSWAVPHLTDSVADTTWAWTSSSTSYVDVFSLHPPILARKGVPGSTSGSVITRVTVSLGAGVTSARIRIGTTSRSPVTAFTATTAGYTTYSYTHTVDCEDTDEASGLQGGAWDGLRIQGRVQVGAGSYYIYAISTYEN